MGSRVHIRREANQRGVGYTTYMSLASRKHSSLPKAIRKDSPVARNRGGSEEVSEKELVSITLAQLPPTTNHMYKPFGGRFHVDSAARDRKTSMAWEARSQYNGPLLESPLRVVVHLRIGTRRNRDVDNIKALLDAMTGVLWVDDGQIVDLRITKRYEKGNEGLDLTVYAV